LTPYLFVLAPLAPFVAWQIIILGMRPSTGGITNILSQQWIPLILVTTLVSNLSTKDVRSILHGTQILVAIMLTTVFTEWLVGWPAPVTAFDADVAWFQGRTIRFGGIWGIRSKGAEGWAEVSYIISLSALLLNRNKTNNLLHIINIAFCGFAISLTGSKTPIAVLLISSIFIILLARNAIRGLVLSAFIVMTVAGLLFAGAFDGTLERFEAEQVRLEENTTRDGLGTGRVGTWSAALHNWRSDGIITILVGGGPLSSTEFVNAGDRLGFEKNHGIHSQHLLILVEFGIVGFAFYIMFWIGLIRLLRKPDTFDANDTFAQLVAAGVMTGLLVRGMTADILNAVYYTWYLAIPIALLTKRRI
jgi:hypothetical protein